MRRSAPCFSKIAAVLFLVFVCTGLGNGYSVLTHEQVVDLLWKDQIQPLLMKKYPASTPDQIRQAHAYAYGGSVIQDLGYYPFGSRYFSDLVHYVRAGDFVRSLIEQSSDLNEFAFALGALAHYASDNSGHPTINQVVAISFPKLRKKYGDHVTYADDPKAHIRTEFGFDMVQVAKNRYTSDTYHDFIGFEVSKPVLERAFLETYGLKLSDVFGGEDLSIGTFRHAIATVIPQMTRAALVNRRNEIVHDTPNFNEKQFRYHLSRTDYQKEWGKGYRKPKLGARILAFFLKIIPKVGPFNALAFKIPTTQTEDMYITSINRTVDNYGSLLRRAGEGPLQLPNLDCDTGKITMGGEYSLADKTHGHLLGDLSKNQFAQLTPELRKDLLDFYSDPNSPIATKQDKKAWSTTLQQIEGLKSWSPPVPGN